MNMWQSSYLCVPALGVLVESEPPEKLPFALLGCGRTLCLLNTLWLLWLSGLASTSCSDPGGTIYSTPGIAMVLEVEEYGDPAILIVIFKVGWSRSRTCRCKARGFLWSSFYIAARWMQSRYVGCIVVNDMIMILSREL